jgi:hypothetical protein
MSQDAEKYRKWVREREAGRAAAIYYLGKAIIQELGEEKGTALIVKQMEEMGHSFGRETRKANKKRALDNSFRNYFSMNSGDSVYDFAWVGDTKKSDSDEVVVEFSYCPNAEQFMKLGKEAVKIGELFCNHIDDADIQGYNPDYECKRESSLNLNGLCRLHFRKKQ